MGIGRIKFLVAVVLSTVMVFGATPALSRLKPEASDRGWRDDINQMRSELEKIYFSGRGKIEIGKESFKTSCDGIISRLPKISDDEVALELMKTLALVRDGHLGIGYQKFTYYPFVLYWLDDGLHCELTLAQYKGVLRLRLVRVANMPVEEVIERVKPYISHDSRYWIRHVVWSFIANAQLLKHAGIASSASSCQYTFAGDDGKEMTVEAKPITLSRDTPWVSDEGMTEALRKNTPYFRQGSSPYFYVYIEEKKTMYVNYVRCFENKNYPFQSFFNDMKREWEMRKPEKFILDIRFNSGGSTLILYPLLEWLGSNERLSDPANLFVLIGRRTFSAASQNAIQLYLQTKATFVGEPIGQKPNHWGQTSRFMLKNNQFEIYTSSKYMTMWRERDPETIHPDTMIMWNHNDYFNGIDTVMDAVLSGSVPPSTRFPLKDPARTEAYDEDLTRLKAEFMLKADGLGKAIKARDFDRAIDECRRQSGTKTDVKIFLDLNKTLRSYGNPLLKIGFNSFANPQYALKTKALSDGLYCVSTTTGNQDVLGKKFVALHGKTLDQLSTAFKSHFSFDDFGGFAQDNMDLLLDSQLLFELGITDMIGPIELTIEDVQGKRKTVELKRVSGAFTEESLVSVPDPGAKAMPLYLSFNGESAVKLIEGSGVLYCSIQTSGFAANGELTEKLLSLTTSKDVRKIVVDFRPNGTNDSGLESEGMAFLEKLAGDLKNSGKPVYVVTNNQTPAWGLFWAAYLKASSKVTLVGEAPSLRLSNTYECRSGQTESRGISFVVPFIRHKVSGFDEGQLLPDKEIKLEGRHYFDSVDPVQDWILKQE